MGLDLKQYNNGEESEWAGAGPAPRTVLPGKSRRTWWIAAEESRRLRGVGRRFRFSRCAAWCVGQEMQRATTFSGYEKVGCFICSRPGINVGLCPLEAINFDRRSQSLGNHIV
jgi:hypothetical protein